MYQLGVVFDIDGVGGGAYGYRSYMVLFEALEPSLLAGCDFASGDTSATLAGRENHFCIALGDLDAARLAKIRAALAVSQAPGLLAGSERFMEAGALSREPLVGDGFIDANLTFDDRGSGSWAASAWRKVAEQRAETGAPAVDAPAANAPAADAPAAVSEATASPSPATTPIPAAREVPVSAAADDLAQPVRRPWWRRLFGG